ncbi:unnamed protein product [Linum tenue]|uniref:TIR domain-containing protein n=3 Tax=Linum tenue TaxID=586396 RepID=A0AAV0II35_9ROSI|nr:unnamed protein product [Linum tenue]
MSTNTLLRRNLSLALPPTSPLPPPPPPPPRAPLLSSYDVFLSFRGEDVRGKFVDHLYARLQGLKVNAFMDEKKLARGEVIEKSILTAIERSRFSVVVFSLRYADSEWCLDELVKIVRCAQNKGHVAMPVFFHVSPDDVAGQAGVYEEAFVKHEKGFKRKRVENWRKALITVAGISGWCLGENESEATLVEEISKTIQLKLKQMVEKSQTRIASIASVVNRMKSSWARSPTVKEVNLFSHQILEDIDVIRVCGLGGLESTKSAKLVYDNVLAHRESQPSGRNDKTFRLKPTRSDQQDHPELKWTRKVWDNDGGDIITAVRTNHTAIGGYKKVLALVDDVEKLESLLRFAAVMGWLGSGSRIVLSTVDVSKKILKVIHIYMEGPTGGENGNWANNNNNNKYLDVACFMKEMVNGGDLMKRVDKCLANGGLPAEIDVKVRVERFDNVGMVENGKLEVAATATASDDEEDGEDGTLLDGEMWKKKSSTSKGKQPKVMQVSILVFAVVFIVSRVGPRSPVVA